MQMMRVAWLLLLSCLPACGRQEAPVVASTSVPMSQPQAAQPIAAQRVVTLTPGLAEFMYAIGAESSLLATVEYSDYPEAAKHLPRVGDAFRVDLERLLALKPDLVLAWTSGTPAATVAKIRALGLRVETVEVSRLDEVATTLRTLGAFTGHRPQAEQVAQRFTQSLADLRTRYAQRPVRSVFIEVNRKPLYTVNGRHVLSEVVQLCGGTNVFADLNQLAPVVGVEAVLARNPQVILSTDGRLAEVRQDWQPWPQISAVRNRHLFVVSPDTATRATPRLLQAATAVCEALEQTRL